MLEAGDAELIHKIPLTIRIIDETEYREELQYQRGRRVEVTKGPSPDDRYPDQDWEGAGQFHEEEGASADRRFSR